MNEPDQAAQREFEAEGRRHLAKVEARRSAAITVWQVDRYYAAADDLNSHGDESDDMDAVRAFYVSYDHVQAEIHFLVDSAAELLKWLKAAGFERPKDKIGPVTVVRNLLVH
jgi:phosphoglycolate phosphatase-like HAD superfamily hydrolase